MNEQIFLCFLVAYGAMISSTALTLRVHSINIRSGVRDVKIIWKIGGQQHITETLSLEVPVVSACLMGSSIAPRTHDGHWDGSDDEAMV